MMETCRDKFLAENRQGFSQGIEAVHNPSHAC